MSEELYLEQGQETFEHVAELMFVLNVLFFKKACVRNSFTTVWDKMLLHARVSHEMVQHIYVLLMHVRMLKVLT